MRASRGPGSTPIPTRAAGLVRLGEFAPHAGLAYAAGRNTDPGPGQRSAVSMLSPYLRRRLVLEREAVEAASAAHGEAARKFTEEVFWRTYWKGFLEQHPSIWTAYRADVRRGWNRLATEGGLRQSFEAATSGETGIACFDAWARELVAVNWLHNHARMWFASIWIFTLRLPWALGADFFARHLLDGDPASNTLSWRWVAGLHTRGRAYVATADNIARFTEDRFDPRGELDEAAEPLTETIDHPFVSLRAADAPPDGEVALLLHDDDLCAETLDLGAATVREVAGFSAAAGMARRGVADAVGDFARGALDDGLARAGRHFDCAAEPVTDVAAWASAVGVPVVTAWSPVGPAAEALAELVLCRVRRPWDEAAWPHARRGFFQLRERIPRLLSE